MTRAKPPDQYTDADPAYRTARARRAAAASHDPRRAIDRITDPELAAQIAEYAARRARELATHTQRSAAVASIGELYDIYTGYIKNNHSPAYAMRRIISLHERRNWEDEGAGIPNALVEGAVHVYDEHANIAAHAIEKALAWYDEAKRRLELLRADRLAHGTLPDGDPEERLQARLEQVKREAAFMPGDYDLGDLDSVVADGMIGVAARQALREEQAANGPGGETAADPDDEVRELADSLTAGTELTWRIERNELGDPLLYVTGPRGEHHVGRTHGGFTVTRPGNRGGEMCKSLDDVRYLLVNGMGAYFSRALRQS